MSAEQQTLLLIIKGTIASLPAGTQESINDKAEHLRRMIKESPDGEAAMALALVGAEMAAQP